MKSRRRVNSTVMFLSFTKPARYSNVVFIALLICLPSAATPQKPNPYPNELPDFRFYATAKWKSLQPLVSTMADVRRVLGPPTEASDMSHFTKPYPGDAIAKEPVFTYDLGRDWEMLVYFVRYCFDEKGPTLPRSMDDRLCSIDLVPKKRLAFLNLKFPAAFKKTHVEGFDGAWDEFTDGSGLVYAVYSAKPQYGDRLAGDLFRIKYGASTDELARYARKSP
jgi:hypothetical protein